MGGGRSREEFTIEGTFELGFCRMCRSLSMAKQGIQAEKTSSVLEVRGRKKARRSLGGRVGVSGEQGHGGE